MTCPDCKTVFLRIISPTDDAYGSPIVEPIFCPRCGKPHTAAALGARVFPTYGAGFEALGEEIREQFRGVPQRTQ